MPSGGEGELVCGCSLTGGVSGTKMETETVQVRRHHRQHQGAFKAFTLMRADAAQTMTFQMMDHGLYAGMPLPHGLERRCVLSHLVSRIAIALLGQRIERQAFIQLHAIVRAVKPAVETTGFERRIRGLTGVDQRHGRGRADVAIQIPNQADSARAGA